jgi:hypothetical protein
VIVLDATTKSLEIILAAAVTTNQLPVVAAYADLDTVSISPGSSDTASNSTSAVTILAAPAANQQRQLKFLNVYNADTVAAIVTIRLNDNSTTRILIKVTLSVGDSLTYSIAQGWKITDVNGFIKTGNVTNFMRDISSFRHCGGSSLERWYYASLVTCSGGTTATSTANVLRAVPFVAPARGGVLDRIGFFVTTTAVGNGRIGLYDTAFDPNGDRSVYPYSLLQDSGSISTGTLAAKTFTISQALNPGQIYWLTLLTDAGPSVRGVLPACFSHMMSLPSTMGASGFYNYTVAFTYAALPTRFPSGAAFNGASPLPALAMRFSS